MKKLSLLILFIAGLNLAAMAQFTKKSPEQRAAHATKSLSKILNLTSDQASKVNAIFLAQATQMDSLKSDPSADKKGSHLAKKSIKLSTDKQLMAVLNSDQQKQYLQWEKMKKAGHHDKKSATEPPVQG